MLPRKLLCSVQWKVNKILHEFLIFQPNPFGEQGPKWWNMLGQRTFHEAHESAVFTDEKQICQNEGKDSWNILELSSTLGNP